MKRVFIVIACMLLGLVALAWLLALIAFEAPDLSRYDTPAPAGPTHGHAGESAEHAAAASAIRAGMATPPAGDRQAQLDAMRRQLDARGEAAAIAATIAPVVADGVRGEWIVTAGTEPGRRLLYLHGGGYVMGSARSHRPITSRFADVAHAAVVAVDYRLLPEATRQDGIDDVRKAYCWMLDNGPAGPSPAAAVIVAGDSCGGNLALATIAWARDEGVRAANAVVALSPHTDATFSSQSLVRNIATDVMQGNTLGPLVRAPRPIALWMGFLMNRMSPRNPAVSPLLGDLSKLPPTLIQVSATEMLLDDAVRYANKARSQGSQVQLQVWPNTLHVWHAFATQEADEVLTGIGRFIDAQLATSWASS